VTTQQRLAEQYRRQQAALSASVVRDVVTLWLHGFDPQRPNLWSPLQALLRTLVLQRSAASVALAAAYYERSREAANVAQTFTPLSPPSPPVELIDTTAGITGPGAYERSLKAGRTPEQARANAGVQLAGGMSRIVANVGRETVQDAVRDDAEALGWVRVTDAKPCAFCSMLASRGPVYRTRGTASFQAHDHCGCVAAAVFDHKEAWLGHSHDLQKRWQDVTQGLSGGDARRAWRRYWESRDTAS
jgi:hypothetical protein